MKFSLLLSLEHIQRQSPPPPQFNPQATARLLLLPLPTLRPPAAVAGGEGHGARLRVGQRGLQVRPRRRRMRALAEGAGPSGGWLPFGFPQTSQRDPVFEQHPTGFVCECPRLEGSLFGLFKRAACALEGSLCPIGVSPLSWGARVSCL